MASDCCPTDVASKSGSDMAEEHCDSASAVNRVDWFLWCVVSSIVGFYLAGQFLLAPSHDSTLNVFAHSVVELFNKMWWGIAIGVIFVGILARIPRDLVMSVLGHRKGFNALLRATCAGVLLDLCSHGILAVAMKLYERGASLGQIMAFLLASPWNSFSLTLILFGLIGVGWTLLFILLSLVIGLISGVIFDRLVANNTLPENPNRQNLDENADAGKLWEEFRASWHFSAGGTASLLLDGVRGSQVVIRWGLFGILLASLIRVLVPAEAFAAWFGASMAGLGMTLVAATIIEVCSEGTTPIAADLMGRAGAPGNAFTFLMAGVSTDYTEIMSIRETMQSWKIALYLPLITLPQILLLGAILNQYSP